jgi:hypothetical protein
MRAHKLDVDPQVLGSLEEDQVSRGEFLAAEHRLGDDPGIGVRKDAPIRKRPLEAACQPIDFPLRDIPSQLDSVSLL